MEPEHYTVLPGSLYGGEYPGAKIPAEAKTRLRKLIEKGIRTFIDLTAPADEMVTYQPPLNALAAETSFPLRRFSFPVPDMRIPDSMRDLLKKSRPRHCLPVGRLSRRLFLPNTSAING